MTFAIYLNSSFLWIQIQSLALSTNLPNIYLCLYLCLCARQSGRIPPPPGSPRFPGSAGIRYSWWLHCDDGRDHKLVAPPPHTHTSPSSPPPPPPPLLSLPKHTRPSEHASLQWQQHHTGWQALVMARTRGLLCQYVAPHQPSVCQSMSVKLFIHIDSNGAPEYSCTNTVAGPPDRNTLLNIMLLILWCLTCIQVLTLWRRSTELKSNWLMLSQSVITLTVTLVLWGVFCF